MKVGAKAPVLSWRLVFIKGILKIKWIGGIYDASRVNGLGKSGGISRA